MEKRSRQRLHRTTITFWLLLLYIIAALIWWFISLEKQNQQIVSEQRHNLEVTAQTMLPGPVDLLQKNITVEARKNTRKYVAEGITFLILILIGAFYVNRSIRKQFKLQQQQENFMMAVTHELKTPIAVTRLNLETLQKYNLDPEKEKKLIQTTIDETVRLNFLTTNILLSSQLEGGGYHFSKEDLDLSDLLKDCIRDFQNRFPDRKFSEEISPGSDMKGDALLLQMLINNLLENAVKYSPKNSPIQAKLSIKSKALFLTISDEGDGIPEEEKKKIFSKFYRIGNEATRKKQGTGLGLYLCKKIAADHNANISVTNNEPRGSKFAVVFNT